jgi:hypothetical protein
MSYNFFEPTLPNVDYSKMGSSTRVSENESLARRQREEEDRRRREDTNRIIDSMMTTNAIIAAIL